MKHAAIALVVIPLLAASAKAQWSLRELHPERPNSAVVYGSAGGRLFGVWRPERPVGGAYSVASLWNADLTGRVDLHPPGVRSSVVRAADGHTQGGYVGVGDLVWHAALWHGSAESYVSLHRLFQFRRSEVRAIDGERQFGIIYTMSTESPRASMWTGTADSWVSLNPAGATSSSIYAAFEGVQGGAATFDGSSHAGLWRASAATWTDLHPAGRAKSWVQAMARHVQVGTSSVPSEDPSQTGGFDTAMHACLWHGTAESWTELHPQGAIQSIAYAAIGRWQVGWFGTEVYERACVWTGSAESMVDLHPLFKDKYTRTLATDAWIEGGRLRVLVQALDPVDNRWEYIIASRPLPCGADLDDGSGTGRRDEAVDVQDLLFFLDRYESEDRAADTDDGSGEGVPDGDVTLGDLLYFLGRFEIGC